MGMEGHSYSECGVFPGHGNLVNGTWSLCAYLVASWHGIPSRGCSPFSKYTCKYLCKYFILLSDLNVNFIWLSDIQCHVQSIINLEFLIRPC